MKNKKAIDFDLEIYEISEEEVCDLEASCELNESKFILKDEGKQFCVMVTLDAIKQLNKKITLSIDEVHKITQIPNTILNSAIAKMIEGA